MFYYRTMCLYLFILYMILLLHVRDNSGNVKSKKNVTLVMNMRHTERRASRETDEFDVVLFQIYRSMCQ